MVRHLQKLGLARAPFPPTPDTGAYFQTETLERDLVEATHSLRTRSGFVLLTGEVGTGKTTFLRRLIADLEADGMVVSLVFNTFLQGPDLLAAVLRDFGLQPHGNPAADIEVLNRFLLQRWQQQTTCVLVIDDAQNLGVESLELLRLLTCLESGQEKLLQIVLAGQPELLQLLEKPQMRQLTSRINTHVELHALDADTTGDYVRFRLEASGANGSIPLADDAARLLHKASRGNPRRIHLIMDRCLYGLYGNQGVRHIDAGLIRVATREAGVRKRPVIAFRPKWAIAASTALLASAAGLWSLLGSQTTHAEAITPPLLPVPAVAPATACVLPGEAPILVTAIASTEAPDLPESCVQKVEDLWQISWRQRLEESAMPVEERTARLQQQLHQLGQYDGNIDGQMGPLTQRALQRLQRLYRLPVTGQPDDLTIHLVGALTRTFPASTITTDVHTHDG